MMPTKPTIVELEMDQLDDLLRRAEAKQLRDEDYETIRELTESYVVYNDDTTVRILELMGKRARQQALADESSKATGKKKKPAERKGLFTSGIVSTREGRRIALFFSGRKHAGEIAYLLRHWEKLTLFLRVAGAPLDNNICEQALKKAILHRKNALFYKTHNGARVGDLYMSLIYSCQLCEANPFDYLTELDRHADDVALEPQRWLPWNYRQSLGT